VNLHPMMLRPKHIAAGRPSILVVPLLFVGLAVNCGKSCGEAISEAKCLTVPAGAFNRGDVDEKKDQYGEFIVVKSVVEYVLDVNGVEQLDLEIKAAGDASLQTYLDGKSHDEKALEVPAAGLDQQKVPGWIQVPRKITVPADTKRIALVLRYDNSSGAAGFVKPRRIYQLRFTTTKGSGVAKLADAGKNPWDHNSWLLDRYPLSDTIRESRFLRPREPFRFDTTFAEHPTDYPDAISSDEYGYLGGNTFFRCREVRRSRLRPTLGKFVFGPPPTKEAEKEAVTNNRGYLTGCPASLELRNAHGKAIELKGMRLRFQPYHLETCFEAPGVKLKVDSALDFTDMLEVKIALATDKPAILSLSGSFNLPGKWWRQESGIRLGQTVFHYLLGLDVESNVDVKVTENSRPIGYRIELAPSRQAELVVRLKPGYGVKDVSDALISQRASSTSVAQRSRKEYHNFFSRIVPPFSCSDQRLVDLYYYIAYAVRFNVVDIPFGPYAHPYLTYSKIHFGDDGGLNMWAPNVASDTVFLRWLNDKSFGEQCVRKCLESPGCPPLGPFVSPRKDCIWDYREALVVYEFAKCSDNPEFFDLVKKVVRATAEKPLRRSSSSDCFEGLNARSGWIHQYDGSLRHKSYVKGKVWWGSKMNQKLAHIDINSWRYQLLRLAAMHSRTDGDMAAVARLEKQAEVVHETINRLMWDDKIGFYFDYATKDLKRSDVMSVAAFSVLWAGVADRSKADRLVKEHLTNPKEFWSQYVLAGTSLADPRTNPRGYTDGGILMDVSNWIPFQGLLRMGYRDVAEELFWRTIDTMTSHGILTWACDHFTADDATPMGGLTPDSGIVADMILRCGTGFLPRTDELFEFDPLILGSELKSLDWGPYLYKKHWIQVHWRASDRDSKYPTGLTIIVDGARFHLSQPKHTLLRLEEGRLISVPLIPDPLGVGGDCLTDKEPAR